MKLWRRMAKKDEDGRRNGRQIKYHMWMEEQMFKKQARSYPLLDALFKRAGMSYVLSNAQKATLKRMIEEAQAKEKTNEAE